MKIIQKHNECIGCGSCAVLCFKYWKMGEDGKAHLKGSKINPRTQEQGLEIKEIECNQEVVDSCPTQCINIIKSKIKIKKGK